MTEIQAGTTKEIGPRQADTFSLVPPEWILDCQFVEDNAAGLALGALEPEDAFRISQHLSWCPLCARLVHDTRRTVSYLPFSSPQVAPSASAKSKVFDRIKAERLTGPGQQPKTSITTLTIPAASFEIPVTSSTKLGLAGSGQQGSSSNRRFKWEVIAAPLAAVPLIVALAIVGGWALQTQGELRDQRAENREVQAALTQATQQVETLNFVMSGEQAKWTLVPTEGELGSSAGGWLFTTATSDRFQGSVNVRNLPTENGQYEVVFETKDRELHPAGEIQVDADGNGSAPIDMDNPLSEYRAVHIRPDSDEETSPTNDSVVVQDVLYLDMLGNLGGSGGTEANARAN